MLATLVYRGTDVLENCRILKYQNTSILEQQNVTGYCKIPKYQNTIENCRILVNGILM